MTNTDNISRKINDLKRDARFGKNPYFGLEKGAYVETFGRGKNGVTFASVKGVGDFNTIVNYLYNAQTEISSNYSINTFKIEICNLLRKLNNEDRDATLKDWNQFVKELNSRPDVELKILAPIYGVVMFQPTVRLGDFVVYHPAQISTVLKNEYPKNLSVGRTQKQLQNSYKIGIDVVSKDIDKCYQLADAAFHRFENIANFVVGGFHKTYRVTIFNNSILKDTVSIVLSADKTRRTKKEPDLFITTPIDDPSFSDSESGNATIWELTTRTNNDFQKQVIEAIEWCGRAIIEIDDYKALLQYIISLESLLLYNSDQFISPSIVSQLCDNVAFLLGDTYEQRVSFAGYVKDLYKIRSSIVHSGSGKILGISLHTANVICHKIIRRLLTIEPYKNFQTKKALGDHLSKLKYGEPSNKGK